MRRCGWPNVRRRIQEAGERNIVEAKFGESKRFYGLDRILEKTGATTEVMICVTFIAINSFLHFEEAAGFFLPIS